MTLNDLIAAHIAEHGYPPGSPSLAQTAGVTEWAARRALVAYYQAHPDTPRNPRDNTAARVAPLAVEVPAAVSDIESPQGSVLAPLDFPEIIGVTAGEQIDPEVVLARALKEFEQKRALALRKTAQSIKFGAQPIGIYFSGDEHFGDSGTDYARVFDDARIVLETPGMFAWKTGDVVNQFILGRMRAIRDGARLSIPDEWILANKLMTDLAPRLIAVNGGNHCAHWSEIAGGVDQARKIVPTAVLYDPDEILASVFVGKAVTTIRARHKWLGSSIWNPTHPMERAAKLDSSEADVYVGAHTHIAALSRDFVANRQRKTAILTGTYKIYDGFQRREGFALGDGSNGMTLILLPDGSRFAVSGAEAGAAVLRSLRGNV